MDGCWNVEMLLVCILWHVAVSVDSIWRVAVLTSRSCYNGGAEGSGTTQHQHRGSACCLLSEHTTDVQHLSCRLTALL